MRIFIIFFMSFTLPLCLCSQCEHPDYIGLMQFYESLGGDSWNNNDGWRQGAAGSNCQPCSWYGVTCKNDRVTCIDLDGNPSCNSLFIDGNNLQGQIPDFECSELERLILGHDPISGAVPDFTGLPNLQLLSINNTQVSGDIPNFSGMPKIQNIKLNNNALGGSIPDLDKLPELSLLHINYNFLVGCYKIGFCDINFQAIGNIGLLDGLSHFEYCNPNCVVPICNGTPVELQQLDELRKLYFATDGNNWDNDDGWNPDSISCSYCFWPEISCTNSFVTCIDLDGTPDCQLAGSTGNNLTGMLPELNFQKLQHLYLDGNNLFGLLPSFDSMPELETLVLSGNAFEGPLPEFKNNTKLKQIRLSFNLLEGPIPDYSHLTQLKVLSISHNNLSGCYTQNLCNLDLFDVANNLEMPWMGDHQHFCNGEEQLGAPCEISDNGLIETIQDDCTCFGLVSPNDEKELSVSIFPNPVASLLSIKSDTKEMHFSIMDINGIIIKEGVYYQIPIDVSALSSGIYLLKVKYGKKSEIFQMVKI